MSEQFNVIEGQLYYGTQRVGHDATSPGFNSYIFGSSALGEGANGITFRAQHSVLKVDHVVKLYFESEERGLNKARLEAQKNANPSVRDIIAQVHHAGVYEYPVTIAYSIMERITDFQTLKEWLRIRDNQWAFAKALRRAEFKERDTNARELQHPKSWVNWRSRTVMAEALDVAAGVIGSIARLHLSDVTHGDLNKGNILVELARGREGQESLQVSDEKTLEMRGAEAARQRQLWLDLRTTDLEAGARVLLSDSFEPYRHATNPYLERSSYESQPGTLRYVRTKVIDLGTSREIGTSKEIGTAREIRFIIDNVNSILKPFFEQEQSSRHLLLIKRRRLFVKDYGEKRYIETYVHRDKDNLLDPLELLNDLFRLVCVMNIFLGHYHNSRDDSEDATDPQFAFDTRDHSDLETLALGPLKGFRAFELDTKILDQLEAFPTSKYESIVDWHAVFEYWDRKFDPSQKYEEGITSTLRKLF